MRSSTTGMDWQQSSSMSGGYNDYNSRDYNSYNNYYDRGMSILFFFFLLTIFF